MFIEWINDLPQEFQNKENIEIIINAFSRQLSEVDKMFNDIVTLTDIDTAIGENLDLVGTIIPLSRKEAGELAGVKSHNVRIDDELYRRFLKYKQHLDVSRCTYFEIIDALSYIFEYGGIKYREDPKYPATIFLKVPFYSHDKNTMWLDVIPMVKASGVRINIEYEMISYKCNQYVGGIVMPDFRYLIGMNVGDVIDKNDIPSTYSDIWVYDKGDKNILKLSYTGVKCDGAWVAEGSFCVKLKNELTQERINGWDFCDSELIKLI